METIQELGAVDDSGGERRHTLELETARHLKVVLRVSHKDLVCVMGRVGEDRCLYNNISEEYLVKGLNWHLLQLGYRSRFLREVRNV